MCIFLKKILFCSFLAIKNKQYDFKLYVCSKQESSTEHHNKQIFRLNLII